MSTAQVPSSDGRPEFAPLSRRFLALLLDWVMCVLITGLFGSAQRYPWAAPAAVVAEYAFFVGLFGQTPGMWAARIRCVSIHDRRPVGPLRAALRGFLLVLVVPALLMDADQRGLHDRLTGSVVLTGRRPDGAG